MFLYWPLKASNIALGFVLSRMKSEPELDSKDSYFPYESIAYDLMKTRLLESETEAEG